MNASLDDARANSAPLGLYIHIPFCERKCPYCDFNTYAGLDALHDDLVDALCSELARWRGVLSGRPISTVFVGGGTPTLLRAKALTQLFDTIHDTFEIAADAEITCEANPGTVDRSKFGILRSLGVNRLSMGVQSFQPEELQFLGRIHSVADVYQAWDAARDAGFDNINLDFIFGLPEAKPNGWNGTIDCALELAPEHMSLYSLIVEENTPLHHWVSTGEVAAPDDDVAAMQYEVAMQRLDSAGYAHYEVSNWAKRTQDGCDESFGADRSCAHNLIYWRNQEYLGIGPGAFSHLTVQEDDGTLVEKRWGNHRPVAGYVRRVRSQDSIEAFSETISPELSMGETMMLGLRLLHEGVSQSAFQRRYGMDVRTVFGDQLTRWTALNMLECKADTLRLTHRGAMVGNQIFMDFLPDVN